jgi:hypothetical protein
MQLVYLGNTLINDVMLGSQRMDDVLQIQTQYVKTNLQALYDGNFNATTSSWRTVVGNATASIGSGVQFITGSNKTPYYNVTGSINSFAWGTAQNIIDFGLSGTGARTVLLWINPTNLTNESVLTWYGQNAGGTPTGDIELLISSQANSNRLIVSASTAAGAIATGSAVDLGSVTTGSWQMVGYTTDGGNTIGAFNLWLNGNKQILTGSRTWSVNMTGGNNFWEFALISAAKPYSGSVAYQFIYNRKLTDTEIVQNYQYMLANFNQ